MENKAKPRICEILGVDVGESFKVDFQSVTGVFSVDSDGTLRHKDNVKCCEVLSYMINHPECIHKARRWTPEEVELAKAIKLVWEKAHRLRSGFNLHRGWIFIEEEDGSKLCVTMEADRFPSLKPGESALLSDIIGGDGNG